jgi:outer membrane protein OmpA-like peptidoglycan-associated protein
MGYADCIGQNGPERVYIFVMSMRGHILWPAIMALAFASPWLRGDTGDVENSRDYPGLPRIPGFVITDYDEDNPAEFDFPIARPTSTDSDHVDKVQVRGHRYVIRYEVGGNAQAPTLLQIQQYYEKLATEAGFKPEKTGAVGDVTETFHLSKDGHDLWVYLDPSITINILTIVEANGKSLVIPVVAPPAPVAQPPPTSPVLPTPMPQAEPEPVETGDSLYRELVTNGRVVLPLTFLTSKSDLDEGSQPVIDRLIVILKAHPELHLEIAGHTDGTGDPQANQRLSTERALTVRDVLIDDGHINKERLIAMGMGGTEPVADDNTADGRAKNRRIELVMLNDAETSQKEVDYTPPQPSPPEEAPSAPAEDPSEEKSPVKFYGPAPNGINYYPKDKTP